MQWNWLLTLSKLPPQAKHVNRMLKAWFSCLHASRLTPRIKTECPDVIRCRLSVRLRLTWPAWAVSSAHNQQYHELFSLTWTLCTAESLMSSQIFPQAIKFEAYKTFHIHVKCVGPVKSKLKSLWYQGFGLEWRSSVEICVHLLNWKV